MEDLMLTTFDNPFNPFTQWKEWFNFDFSHGHKTCEMLASFSNTNVYQSESEYESDKFSAMYSICDLLPEIYKVVSPSDFN